MLDCGAFGLTESEGRVIDPQQRLLLETGLEAFLQCPDSQAEAVLSTGVYVGIMKVRELNCAITLHARCLDQDDSYTLQLLVSLFTGRV